MSDQFLQKRGGDKKCKWLLNQQLNIVQGWPRVVGKSLVRFIVF
jgi:hypothetical protein